MSLTETSFDQGRKPECSAPIEPTPLFLELSHGRVATLVWTITLAILAIGLAREVYVYANGPRTWLGPMRQLSLDSENALGDWWGTIQFALGALLLAINARTEPDRRWRYHWTALALIFVFLSVDENVGLHEQLGPLLQPLQLTGLLRYSWIIPYSIACLVIGLIYLPFLRQLPPGFRWRVVLAGVIFVAAALGAESVQGYCRSYSLALCFAWSRVVEEGGEMIALSLFIVSLFDLLRARQSVVTVRLT